MLIRVPVHVANDVLLPTPEYAEIELSSNQLAKIFKLADTVRELSVASIEDWSYVDRFYEEDYDAEVEEGPEIYKECEFRVECSRLVVTEDSIRWSGYAKHTDVEWETESIDLRKLVGEEVDLCEESFQ